MISNEQLLDIARIHKDRINDILSCLSVSKIAEFYEYLEKDNNNRIFTIEKDNRTSGFALFTINPQKFKRKFIRKNAISIIVSPIALLKLLKSLLIINSIDFNESCKAFLSEIAVDEIHEGKGLARKLIDSGELWFKENGVSEYFLKVERTNRRALDFYEKSGFSIIAKTIDSMYMKKFL